MERERERPMSYGELRQSAKWLLRLLGFSPEAAELEIQRVENANR